MSHNDIIYVMKFLQKSLKGEARVELINKITNDYSSFKGSSKKIADYLLKNSETFLNLDAQRLGIETKTSSASIIRFCQQMGFKGLKDFKIELAKGMSKNDISELNTFVRPNDTAEEIIKKFYLNVINNLRSTYALLDANTLQRVVKCLRKANQIYIEGVGASGLAAQDLFFKFVRSGKRVCYNSDPHIALERMYYSTPQDAVVIFSYSGFTEEIIYIAKQAKKNKTPVIAITRGQASSLLSVADIIVSLPDREKLLRIGAIDSLLSEIYVSSLIYLATINNLPNLKEKMKNTERLTNQLKENN